MLVAHLHIYMYKCMPVYVVFVCVCRNGQHLKTCTGFCFNEFLSIIMFSWE